MDIEKIIAFNFKALRESEGLSVIEMAKELDVTRQTIYNIEGAKTLIQKPLLQSICKYFKIESDYLFQKNHKK